MSPTRTVFAELSCVYTNSIGLATNSGRNSFLAGLIDALYPGKLTSENAWFWKLSVVIPDLSLFTPELSNMSYAVVASSSAFIATTSSSSSTLRSRFATSFILYPRLS